MALDPLTTSLVGLVAGAVGVAAHVGAQWLDGGLARSRERALLAIFFAFLSGFLFAWVWRFAALTLVPALAFPGLLAGLLWGAFIWLTFILPSEMAHVVWRRQEPNSATAVAGAWLAQFIVGGAICGHWLV